MSTPVRKLFLRFRSELLKPNMMEWYQRVVISVRGRLKSGMLPRRVCLRGGWMMGRVAKRNRSVVVGRLGRPVLPLVDVLRLRLFRPNRLSMAKLDRVVDRRSPGSVPRVVECRYWIDWAKLPWPRTVRPGITSCRCRADTSQPVVFPPKPARQEPLAEPLIRRSCRYWNRCFSRNPVLASMSPVIFMSKYSFGAQ